MTTPTNHHLTLTDRNGKIVHGRVVYAHRIADRSTEVHIVTIDWLSTYRYPATYRTPTLSTRGFYTVLSDANADGPWLFKGIFEREQD